MKTLLTLCAALSCITTYSQIAVTGSNDATALAQSLAGNGVSISNATITAANNSSGSFFANNNTDLGIQNGVVLSTGRISDISKGADAGLLKTGATYNNKAAGDAQLQAIVGVPTYNASALTFDVVPTGDQITFRYVFMSEEYPDYVCANYNDIFAFFVNGPRPSQLGGGNYVNKNVAIVPDTNLQVGINTINSGVSGPYSTLAGCQGTNTAYYRSNAGNAYIVYNGSTVVLTATIDVIPCATYNFKLAIADVNDEFYDSGVFIEAGSFISNRATLSTVYSHAGYTTAFEGCSNASVKLNFTEPFSGHNVIKYQISGSATNGIDYQHIADSIIVPIGAMSATINIIPIADNLNEGTETVTISLIDACTQQSYAQTTVSINDTQNVSISANKLQLCANESTTLNASGTMSYSWSPATGLSSTNTAQTVANPASSQTYIVTGTTGNCISTANVLVEKSNISVSGNAVSASCGNTNGSTIDLTITNGKPNYTFAWNDGITSQNRNNLATGNYSVTVTDALGCSAASNFTINSTGGSAINISSQITDATCGKSNGAIALNTSGGSGNLSYAWSNGAQIQNLQNVVSGNYSVTVTDGNGCSKTSAFVIGDSQNMQVNITKTDVSCFGGNNGTAIATVSGNGNYTYTWSNAQNGASIGNLTAGNYTVTVQDANQCSATASITIAQPTSAIAASFTKTDLSCGSTNSGSANITVFGGTPNYNYTWNVPTVSGNSASNLEAGNYEITITDAKNCNAFVTFIINDAEGLALDSTSTAVSCFGGNDGTATIAAIGGNGSYTYVWNNQSTVSTINNVTAGRYFVTVTDANGCTGAASVSVSQAQELSVTGVNTNAGCSALGSIDITVNGGNGGYQALWNDNATQQDRTNLQAGNYSVKITDSKGCTAAYSTTISQNLSLQLAVQSTVPSCFGVNDATASVAVTGGDGNYSFIWSNNVSVSSSASNLSAGLYTITVTDGKGCSSVENFSIAQPASFLVTATPTPNTCFGIADGAALIVANGGVAPFQYSVELVNSSSPINRVTGEFTELSAGSYIVNVKDANGCSAQSNFQIKAAREDVLSFETKATSCFTASTHDGSFQAIVLSNENAPYQFSINNETFSNHTSFEGMAAGTYFVSSKNKNGCVVNHQITVEAAKEFSVELPTDTIRAEMGQSTELSVTTDLNNAVIEWNAAIQPSYLDFANGNETPVSTTPFTNEYEVKVYDANNKSCFKTANIVIAVANEMVMPNAFTPNGDNVNDRIYPIFNNANVRVTDFRIYNSWGQMVSNDVEQGWDGNFNGSEQLNGTFTYFISYERTNAQTGKSETIRKDGTLTLVR